MYITKNFRYDYLHLLLSSALFLTRPPQGIFNVPNDIAVLATTERSPVKWAVCQASSCSKFSSTLDLFFLAFIHSFNWPPFTYYSGSQWCSVNWGLRSTCLLVSSVGRLLSLALPQLQRAGTLFLFENSSINCVNSLFFDCYLFYLLRTLFWRSFFGSFLFQSYS